MLSAKLQTISSDAFLWMKSFLFWLKFHRSLFLRVQLTITQHWFGWDNGLAPNRRQAIIWTNAGLIHWRIYAALGGDELRIMGLTPSCWASLLKEMLHDTPCFARNLSVWMSFTLIFYPNEQTDSFRVWICLYSSMKSPQPSHTLLQVSIDITLNSTGSIFGTNNLKNLRPWLSLFTKK